MESVQELAPVTGVSRACEALGVARSTLYRSIRLAWEPEPPRPRPKPDASIRNDLFEEPRRCPHYRKRCGSTLQTHRMHNNNYSLISKRNCLIVLDTFRDRFRPFEHQFDLPTTAIHLQNVCRAQRIPSHRGKHKDIPGGFQRFRPRLRSLFSGSPNDLISGPIRPVPDKQFPRVHRKPRQTLSLPIVRRHQQLITPQGRQVNGIVHPPRRTGRTRLLNPRPVHQPHLPPRTEYRPRLSPHPILHDLRIHPPKPLPRNRQTVHDGHIAQIHRFPLRTIMEVSRSESPSAK